ncbi:MAG: ATP-binding cassette domain-containing protein [Planctomycetes bacterium]|jgi:ABC-type lipoprotein export system ATPase subunit|nr:ATP-binding cassette domain-containing protein [Planctomycetota bacterium]
MSDLIAQGLHKHYRMGHADLHVLRGVDIKVSQGEWLTVLGRSGSGKSTLLHLLGGLDWPDQGMVNFNGQSVYGLRSKRLDQYRCQHIGFVFQFYHLLPELSAAENVLIGTMIGRSTYRYLKEKSKLRARAEQLLDRVGLAERMKHRPSKLSGGERQRVAIARALINQPDVLLADEPTGNLDADTGAQIMDVFRKLHDEGQTIVMVTHDEKIAAAADRRLTLVRGRLEEPG